MKFILFIAAYVLLTIDSHFFQSINASLGLNEFIHIDIDNPNFKIVAINFMIAVAIFGTLWKLHKWASPKLEKIKYD